MDEYHQINLVQKVICGDSNVVNVPSLIFHQSLGWRFTGFGYIELTEFSTINWNWRPQICLILKAFIIASQKIILSLSLLRELALFSL